MPDSPWLDILQTPIRRDITFHPMYLKCWADAYGAEVGNFIGRTGRVQMLYPYLKRPIPNNQGYFDIVSPMFHGGVLYNQYDPAAFATFREKFHEHCLKENIVAEFGRTHPLLINHEGMPNVQPAGECTIVELARRDPESFSYVPLTHEALLKSFKKAQRNAISSAERRGVEVEACRGGEALVKLYALYTKAMRKKGCNQRYNYPEQWFWAVDENLTKIGGYTVFFAKRHGEVLAGSLVFHGYAHSTDFLRVYTDDIPRHNAHSKLMWEAIKCCQGLGMLRLNLGGGRHGDASSDGQVKFKESWSPLRLPYYYYSQVHDQSTYDHLVTDSNAQDNGFFPKYRVLPEHQYG